MQYPVEEILSWSIDRLLTEISNLLPPGWTFDWEESERWHEGVIRSPDGGVAWTTSQVADQRVLFLDAYGWLTVRSHASSHPAWRPRAGKTDIAADLSRLGYGTPAVQTPDPADLDPVEVRSVYDVRRKD